MSGNVDINFTAQENDLFKAQAKVIKQQEEMIEKYKKLGSEAKKGGKDAEKAAAAAAKELDRFAKATKEINRTPLEKYADEMRKLNIALKAGKIDQETFNRAVGQAKTEFKKAGEAGNEAFGAAAVSKIGALVVATGGLKKIWDEIIGTYRAASAEMDQLGQKQSEAAPSLGMLAQVADTPEDLQRLVGEARKTFAEGGAKSIPEAAKLQFALESGGVGNLRADFSKMQASGLVPDASMMAEAAIKLTAGMGAKETGDFRTVISKAFGGAKKGLGSAEELLQATAFVSSQASRLGLTDEEIMAAVSTGSAVVGPSEAATQMEALMKGIEVEGIGGGFLTPGKTLMQQVAEIKKLEASGEDIRAMLGGRQEAVKGFGMLSSTEGQAAMQANLANIATAEREDWFSQKVTMAQTIPSNAAAIMKRKNAAGEELAAERRATVETVADSLQSDLVEDLRNRGRSEFRIQLAKDVFERQRGRGFFGGVLGGSNETFINRFSGFASEDTRKSIEALGITLDRVGDKLDSAATRLESGVERNLTNAARANQAAAGGAVEAR